MVDTGTLTQADLDAEQVAWYTFVKLEFDATATAEAKVVRFCDFPGVAGYTIDLDGAPAEYDAFTQPFTLGVMEQASQGSVLDVSMISCANLDRRWRDLRKTYGLSKKRITLWVVFFEPGTLALKEKFDPIYEGLTDGVHLGKEAQFSLLPGRPPFIKLFPTRIIDGRLFKWLPPPNMKYQYDDQPLENQAPGGSFSYQPPPDSTYVIPPRAGGLPLVLPTGTRPDPHVVPWRGREAGENTNILTRGGAPRPVGSRT